MHSRDRVIMLQLSPENNNERITCFVICRSRSRRMFSVSNKKHFNKVHGGVNVCQIDPTKEKNHVGVLLDHEMP